MTQEFNPYQPPQAADHGAQIYRRSESRVRILDWGIAFLLGGTVFCAVFIAVSIGTTISLMASGFVRLVPYHDAQIQIGLLLCSLLSLATGYSAGANYLLQRVRQGSGPAVTEGNAEALPPSRFETVLGKTTTLDKLLTGCFTGLILALLLAPLAFFLLDRLCRKLGISEDQAYWILITGFVGSIVVGLSIGWHRWRRI